MRKRGAELAERPIGETLVRYDNARRAGSSLSCLGVLWLFSTIFVKGAVSEGPADELFLFLPPVVFLSLALRARVWAWRARRGLEESQVSPGDAGELEPLMIMVERHSDQFSWSTARDHLMKRLSTIRSEGADDVSKDGMTWMLRKLDREAAGHFEVDIALTRAILTALKQVGTPAAVPLVERLAESAPNSLIREAAAESLPAIRERAALTESGSTLLRPSANETEAGTTLVRPATAQPGTPPDQLLRPH